MGTSEIQWVQAESFSVQDFSNLPTLTSVYCLGTLKVKSYCAWSRKLLRLGYQLSRAPTLKLPPPSLVTTRSPSSAPLSLSYSMDNSCSLPRSIAWGITT